MIQRSVVLAAVIAPMLATPAFAEGKSNAEWWPERLNLSALRQHGAESDPMGAGYDYAKEFATLDLAAVKRDIAQVLTSKQDWWPADYGHYGPFFIRMAWHSAGSYRTADGRGGADGAQLRFEPLNSWPDNVNLDKARRLLWPVKKKYGKKLSWGDLMVLTGNVSLESMGFKTFGFAGGRVDQWEPDLVFWGPEVEWLADARMSKDRKVMNPLAAVQMGLIYVNPEGPNGHPDPIAAGKEIREAFGRMAMDDEETVALIAGGHSFGKAHGAHAASKANIGPEVGAAPVEAQGFGWHNAKGKGKAEDTVTSGLEGAWTATPTRFTSQFLDNLYNFEWEQTKSPAGATQWVPKDGAAAGMVPDAHVPGKRHQPIMFTTDLALRFDPAYGAITKRWQKNPQLFEAAFSRAWFKLTHRDLGPRSRYLGKLVPATALAWQDPVPAGKAIAPADQAALKAKILASGLTTAQLVKAAWASASTFRDTDLRGGANGARVRLEPQRSWAANDPAELAATIKKLDAVRRAFGKPVSLADTIVLGGNAAIERAAAKGGVKVAVPFKPGRGDASQAQTDVHSFGFLKPTADGFRNYYSAESRLGPAEALVDKADTLSLKVPEMVVLVGGLRVLQANAGGTAHGVFTSRPGTLSNDFFVNLLDMKTQWTKAAADGLYEGRDRKTHALRWTATPVDLVFGSNSELRAVSEVYAADDAKTKFVKDFASAWGKVMELDR